MASRKQREYPRFGKKLWSTQVEEILDVLSLMGDEASQTKLAEEYEVTQSAISQIKRGLVWKDLVSVGH